MAQAPTLPSGQPVGIVAARPAEAPRTPVGSDSNLRAQLEVLTHGERVDFVRAMVQKQVIRVLRLRPDAPPPGANDRLMSIGMDSLMAVELAKHLHREIENSVKLPSTLIFDFPTIGAIAELVLRLFEFTDEPAQQAPTPVAPKSNAAAAAIADLSDEEVEALLAEQLKGFPT
jgi:acyl carrier protein